MPSADDTVVNPEHLSHAAGHINIVRRLSNMWDAIGITYDQLHMAFGIVLCNYVGHVTQPSDGRTAPERVDKHNSTTKIRYRILREIRIKKGTGTCAGVAFDEIGVFRSGHEEAASCLVVVIH
jgi:hypothetical protein